MKYTYIDKKNRFGMAYAGHSKKYGPCEITGHLGDLWHIVIESEKKHGGFTQDSNTFATKDACRNLLLSKFPEFNPMRYH